MVYDDGSNGVSTRANARTAAKALIEFIERSIADGTWPPGHRLPTERDLVKQFGLARNTLRKELQELEMRGTIVRHVGRGTFVAAKSTVPYDDMISRIHRASPAEIMEVRLMLEPQIVELVVARATAEDFAAMDEALTQGEAADTIKNFEYWDGRLHQAMLSAARNSLLADIYDAINSVRHTAEWGKLKERSLTPERRLEYQKQHRRVVDELKKRDSEAARQTLVDHLRAVRYALIGI